MQFTNLLARLCIEVPDLNWQVGDEVCVISISDGKACVAHARWGDERTLDIHEIEIDCALNEYRNHDSSYFCRHRDS